MYTSIFVMFCIWLLIKCRQVLECSNNNVSKCYFLVKIHNIVKYSSSIKYRKFLDRFIVHIYY